MTLSCAALSLLLLPLPAARAGHWVLTTTGSGQANVDGGMQENFTAPPPSTGSVTIPRIGAGAGEGPCFHGTPDTGSDNTPPQCVLLTESSTACANCENGGPAQAGQADDGWGDAPTTTSTQGGPRSAPRPRRAGRSTCRSRAGRSRSA